MGGPSANESAVSDTVDEATEVAVTFHVDVIELTGRRGEPLLDCLDRHGIYL